MVNLTKREIVEHLSDATGMTQSKVLEVLQRMLDYIEESLASGNNVEFRNFGVFELKQRKNRIGRNPKRPETDVLVPARAVVKFKAGKELKARVLRLSESMEAQRQIESSK